jgi:hypothetical protein
MERLFNAIYYLFYRIDYRLHLIFNKINPFMLLYELPFLKRLYQRKNINIRREIDEAFKRPDIGISSVRACGGIGILIILICLGLVNVFSGLTQISIRLRLHHFIMFSIASIAIFYFMCERRDKYLAYFKEFGKMSKDDKKKWARVCLITIICILFFFIGSCIFTHYRLK